VYLFEAEVAERDVDALGWPTEERPLAARVGRIVLRELGREEATRGAPRWRAIEVVRALRTPAPAATDRLELTCDNANNAVVDRRLRPRCCQPGESL